MSIRRCFRNKVIWEEANPSHGQDFDFSFRYKQTLLPHCLKIVHFSALLPPRDTKTDKTKVVGTTSALPVSCCLGLTAKRIPLRHFWFYSNVSECLDILQIIFVCWAETRNTFSITVQVNHVYVAIKKEPRHESSAHWLLAVDEWTAESILAGQLLCNGSVLYL